MVALSDIAEAIRSDSPDFVSYYDKKKDKIVFYGFNDPYNSAPDFEESDDFIRISDVKYFNPGYECMSKFAYSASDHNREFLVRAISGKGAFRHFRDTVEWLDLEMEWHSFEIWFWTERAKAWCADYDVKYTE